MSQLGDKIVILNVLGTAFLVAAAHLVRNDEGYRILDFQCPQVTLGRVVGATIKVQQQSGRLCYGLVVALGIILQQSLHFVFFPFFLQHAVVEVHAQVMGHGRHQYQESVGGAQTFNSVLPQKALYIVEYFTGMGSIMTAVVRETG